MHGDKLWFNQINEGRRHFLGILWCWFSFLLSDFAVLLRSFSSILLLLLLRLLLLNRLWLLPLLLWYVFSWVLICLCLMLFDLLLLFHWRLVWELVEHLRLSSGRLFLIHHWRWFCNDLFWLNKYLIVLVAVMISNFILIMCTLPLTIHNKLILMEPRRQLLAHCECSIR